MPTNELILFDSFQTITGKAYRHSAYTSCLFLKINNKICKGILYSCPSQHIAIWLNFLKGKNSKLDNAIR